MYCDKFNSNSTSNNEDACSSTLAITAGTPQRTTTQPRHDESASRGGMALLSSSSQVTPNNHRAQHAFVPWHSAIFFRSLRKQRTNRSVAHLLCWIHKGRRRAKDTKSFAVAVEVICHKLQGSGGEISNDGIKRSCTRVVLRHYYISNNVAFDTADSAEVRLKMLRSIQQIVQKCV